MAVRYLSYTEIEEKERDAACVCIVYMNYVNGTKGYEVDSVDGCCIELDSVSIWNCLQN